MAYEKASVENIPKVLFTTLPPKGEFGGRCNNPQCFNIGADWHSQTSDRYYCDECARELNEGCLTQGKPKACKLRLA